MEFLKRTWAEIDLDALRYNAEAARSCLSSANTNTTVANVTQTGVLSVNFMTRDNTVSKTINT